MRTVNFKGMIVRQHDDEHFEIMPPPFLFWPAKTVIIYALFAEVLVSTCFLFNSSDLFACILLGSISLSLASVVGYIKESFPAIFFHFSCCILHIIICCILVPVVHYNEIVCTNAAVCKRIHDWMNYLHLPNAPLLVYFFVVVSVLSHTFMIPVSWRMVKFTAACSALKTMMKQQEKKGDSMEEWDKKTDISHCQI